MQRKIALVAHNIRSTYNVGSLLRTCDGLGVDELIFSGYTPYPKLPQDERLPHLAEKIHNQIKKTALGAETSVNWLAMDIEQALTKYQKRGYKTVALEQTKNSKNLPEYRAPEKILLILGEELRGIETKILNKCDDAIEIPMLGKKESFNVAQAAAMALYHLRFIHT